MSAAFLSDTPIVQILETKLPKAFPEHTHYAREKPIVLCPTPENLRKTSQLLPHFQNTRGAPLHLKQLRHFYFLADYIPTIVNDLNVNVALYACDITVSVTIPEKRTLTYISTSIPPGHSPSSYPDIRLSLTPAISQDHLFSHTNPNFGFTFYLLQDHELPLYTFINNCEKPAHVNFLRVRSELILQTNRTK